MVSRTELDGTRLEEESWRLRGSQYTSTSTSKDVLSIINCLAIYATVGLICTSYIVCNLIDQSL